MVDEVSGEHKGASGELQELFPRRLGHLCDALDLLFTLLRTRVFVGPQPVVSGSACDRGCILVQVLLEGGNWLFRKFFKVLLGHKSRIRFDDEFSDGGCCHLELGSGKLVSGFANCHMKQCEPFVCRASERVINCNLMWSSEILEQPSWF